MDTIRKMIAKNIDEWQVRQYALGWYEKTLLLQEDLIEIETLYAEKEAQRLAEIEAQKEAEMQIEEILVEEEKTIEEVPIEEETEG